MAYNVYCSCDECGAIGTSFINETVSKSMMAKIVRHHYGWHITKDGWICPECWKSTRNNKNLNKAETN